MKNEDLTLGFVSGPDQPLPFQEKMIEAVQNNIDEVIMRCMAEGSLEEAWNVGAQFITAGRVSGIGLAKLAVEMKKCWHKFEIGADFEDVAYQNWGLSKTTLLRYMRIWEMRESGDVPDELKDALLQRDLKDQSAIATLWESVPLQKKDWKRIANADTNAELLEVIRDIKGDDPRPNSLTLKMDRSGTIRGYYDTGSIFVGYLNVEEEDKDAHIRKAIARILNNAGIIRE